MSNSNYSVLTPYMIPSELLGRKVVNLGDGFILRAIERQIGHFANDKCFTPRIKPTEKIKQVLKSSRTIILAGANQLNDHFSVWPGLTPNDIREQGFRFIPFGIGLHGQQGMTDSMSANTKEILEVIHDEIKYSSWRCPHTVSYLKKELPHLQHKFLMTGCPVVFDTPLLEGSKFNEDAGSVVVTVTERHDFWSREINTLDFVARRFRNAKRYLVLHQNFSPPGKLEYLRNTIRSYDPEHVNLFEKLRWYASKRGFIIVTPKTADECIMFYRNIDLHFGSRLHAHLLFLSRNKRSFLTRVDGRADGMAEFLGFPLCNPERFDDYLNFDFERTRKRARITYKVMKTFIESIPE